MFPFVALSTEQEDKVVSEVPMRFDSHWLDGWTEKVCALMITMFVKGYAVVGCEWNTSK